MSPPIESTRFVIELVKKLYRPGANLVLSPYSLTSALVMLIAGADGNTRAELVKAMFDEEVTDDGSDGDKYVKAFAAVNKAIVASNGATLKIANLLYSDQSIELKADYVSTLTEQINATGKQLDFVNGPAEAVKVINSDVSQATNGMIKSAIDRIEHGFEEVVVLILVNAIYFKDIWKHPFSVKETTESGDFHTLSGEVVKTALMHKRSGSIKYHQDDDRYHKTGAKAVQLDYQEKGNIAMVLILPKEGVSMQTYLNTQFTSSALDQMLRFLRTGFDVILTLPRFKLTSGHDLKGTLIELGVSDTFMESRAKFSRISHHPRPIWVTEIVQKAVIEVNEEGTKAAAATYVGSVCGGCRSSPPPKVEFIANRPFLYALVTKGSCPQVLFIGVVEDPTKG